MKNIFTTSLLFFSILFSAQSISLGAAINKAGKQRMLCYRIAKNYLAIGAKIKTEESLKEIDDAAANFNENYSDLNTFIKDKETKAILNKIGARWQKYRAHVLVTPDEDEAISIIKEANVLSGLCNTLVEKIVTSSGSKTAVLPNICGKERMLSQKMAMYYMADFWKIPYQGLRKEMSGVIESFETNLNMLINATANTDEIDTVLKLQKDEWAFLKKSFDLNSQKPMPASVLGSSNLMLKNFDRVTTMYEVLVN